jgi:16S rRNA (cytosine967-C5)-methyltransferase
MTFKNSRYIAITTLHQLDKSNTVLPVLFEQHCARHQLRGPDRGLAMSLIYGVLRQRQYLEALLARLCRQSLKKMHPLLRHGLTVGLYQLIFLSRIPESAAVNETINGIRAAKVPRRLQGVANGILRQFLRQRDELPGPNDLDEHNRPFLNHPEWMTTRWAKAFGQEEMHTICRCNNNKQPLTLRLNTDKISIDDYLHRCKGNNIEARPGNFAPASVIVSGYQGNISSLPGYADNLFQVQGEAAQLVPLLLQPFLRNGRYLDACAGLGGKTSHLLQLITSSNSSLTAVEPEAHRHEMLQESLAVPAQQERLHIFRGSLQDFSRSTPQLFDGILLDAPCSGTGVTGRQPDIRWRRTLDDVQRYASIQHELLTSAAALLKPGGVLVYATCSLEPEENDNIISTFIEESDFFSLDEPTPYLPESAAPLVHANFFHPRPSNGIDGFFAARLVRRPADD